MNPRSILTSILLAVVAALAAVGPTAAGEFRGAQSVTIAADETVEEDLYVGAGTVTIAGTVDGDATVAGGTVTVSGTINGSLNVGGGTVDVSGDVTGAVRVSGGTVRISGSVGRDVVVAGGTATIDTGADISGDVAGGTGMLTVAGSVAGDLLARSGSLTLSGTVDGSLDVSVGNLVIADGAVVGGDVTYTSAQEAEIADGAEIAGTIERREPTDDPAQAAIPDNPIVGFFGVLVGLLLFGWTLLAIRPRMALGSGEVLRTAPLPALGLGLVAWIGQFVLVVLLVVVGALLAALAGAIGGAFIVAAVVVLLLVVILIFLSAVPVAMALGSLVLRDSRSSYLAYFAGAVILALVVTLAGLLPALGAVVTLIVWVLGLGAYVMYLFRTRHDPWIAGNPPDSPSRPVAAAPTG